MAFSRSVVKKLRDMPGLVGWVVQGKRPRARPRVVIIACKKTPASIVRGSWTSGYLGSCKRLDPEAQAHFHYQTGCVKVPMAEAISLPLQPAMRHNYPDSDIGVNCCDMDPAS